MDKFRYNFINKKHGFTLVELSIVLVIIGLLIGGILVAQSLIDSSRVNAQIKQIKQYDIALNLFYDRYRMIPGDSHGWGNQNGFLEGNGVTPATQMWVEITLYFTELERYKIINEGYSQGGALNYGEGGEIPKAKIGRGGIAMQMNTKGELFYFLGISFEEPYSNAAGVGPFGNAISPTGIMSPAEALAIDSKMDDGNPYTGNVVAVRQYINSVDGGVPYPMQLEPDNAANCVYNSQYNVSLDATSLCRLLIKAEFNK